MKRITVIYLFKFLLLLFILPPPIKAQKQDSKYSFALYYNYTVSSKLYNNPRDADYFIREQYQFIDGIENFSFDFRIRLAGSVSLGVGAGYLKSSFIP